MINFISMNLKYIPIAFCSILVFKKLLNINITKRTLTYQSILSIILSLIMILMRQYLATISISLFIIFLILVNLLIFKQPMETSIVATSISFGITYSLHSIATFLTFPTYAILHTIISNSVILRLCSDLTCSIIHIILCIIPFKFKRFKNGLYFLRKEKINNMGVIIACLSPLATTFFDCFPTRNFYYLVPVIYICMCGILLSLWLRIQLKKDYYKNLRDREIEILKYTIKEQNIQIDNYKSHCDELSKIIHRDNKLIPAMELAVNDALSTISPCHISESANKQLTEISTHLNHLSKERKNIVLNYENKYNILPKTNIISIDATINYMLKKAKSANIEFDFNINENINNICKHTIMESDLNTLLADLIENAIIATSKSQNKKILVILNNENNVYSLSVFDSGIDFEESSFENLGIRKNTTHKETGGSGIGLMTAMDICRKYQASFCIDEILPDNTYTKKVTICFDDLSQIRISTNRKNIIHVCSKRNDITLIHL